MKLTGVAMVTLIFQAIFGQTGEFQISTIFLRQLCVDWQQQQRQQQQNTLLAPNHFLESNFNLLFELL